MHRLEAAIGSREQKRAFELAEHQSGDQIRIARRHAEAEEPAFDLKLPFLERVAGGRAQHFRLRRGFQRGGRDRTTLLVARLLQIGGHAARYRDSLADETVSPPPPVFSL